MADGDVALDTNTNPLVLGASLWSTAAGTVLTGQPLLWAFSGRIDEVSLAAAVAAPAGEVGNGVDTLNGGTGNDNCECS